MVFLTGAPRDVNASSIASIKYSSNFSALKFYRMTVFAIAIVIYFFGFLGVNDSYVYQVWLID